MTLNISSDGKLLASQHFKLKKYFHSQSSDCRGENCGKLHSLLIKPTTCIHSCNQCGCLFGKIEILLWIVDNETADWLPQNAVGISANQIEFTVERNYKCTVFVYQAKVLREINKTGLCNPQFVITANGAIETTKVTSETTSTF